MDDVDPTVTWGGKRWTLIGAAVMLAAVVAALAWVALSSHTPPSTAASTQRRQVTTAEHRPCPLASVESTTIPSATAPPTKWINVNGESFPTTRSDGPLYRSGAEWTCFAHTPMGGLLTATSAIAAGLQGSRAAYASYFPPGHWSSAQIAQQVPAGGTPAPTGTKIIGYEFGAWDTSGGSVTLVETCSQSGCSSPYVGLAIRVQWQSRRWYLVGDTFQVGTGTWLTSLAGVTPWEGA